MVSELVFSLQISFLPQKDFFCINRGELLDPNGLPTLGAIGPPSHTVHCLVDVPQCIASDFEILLEYVSIIVQLHLFCDLLLLVSVTKVLHFSLQFA